MNAFVVSVTVVRCVSPHGVSSTRHCRRRIERADHHRNEIGDVEQRADHEDGDENELICFDRAKKQVPFAPRAAKGRQADYAERADQEAEHGDRHLAADADHVADLGLVEGHHDGAGAEKECDLAEGVHGDMHTRAEHPGAGGQGGAEDDVGKLAHG